MHPRFRLSHGEVIVESLEYEIGVQSVRDIGALACIYTVVFFFLADSLDVLLDLRQADVRTDDADDLPVHLDGRDIACHQLSSLFSHVSSNTQYTETLKVRDFQASCIGLYFSVCNYSRMSKRCQITATIFPSLSPALVQCKKISPEAEAPGH